MAIYWSYGQFRTKVENDLGLQDELFVTPDEMLGYANEAIDKAEALILNLNEDYFLTSAPLGLTDGQSLYSLPSDILMNKIRRIVASQGTWVYPFKRLRSHKEFEKIAWEQGPYHELWGYHYILVNPARANLSDAPSIQIELLPAVRSGDSAAIQATIWYIRTASRMTQDSDICDLPEANGYILQYMKTRCYEKEGHPNLTLAVQALSAEKVMMLEALADRVPDEDNKIELDLSHYWDHS